MKMVESHAMVCIFSAKTVMNCFCVVAWRTGSSPGNQFNDTTTSDLKLTLNNREGYSVTVNVHRHILVTHSRFFAAKLSDRWSKTTTQQQRTNPNLIEITDIDDVEIYLETLRLMYCEDVKRSLMKENVSRILAILKVRACAGILPLDTRIASQTSNFAISNVPIFLIDMRLICKPCELAAFCAHHV